MNDAHNNDKVYTDLPEASSRWTQKTTADNVARTTSNKQL